MLIYFLILFFTLILCYQVFVGVYKNTIREGLLASNPCTTPKCTYSLDDAFHDLTEHDNQITDLEKQVQTNSTTLANLLRKTNNAVGASVKEGMLTSQQKPSYTQKDEDIDVKNQNSRIIALQLNVKQNIIDIDNLNTKLHLPPTNSYPEPETGTSLSLSTSYTNNKLAIIAHETAITNLEEIVKENTVDIEEINKHIQDQVDKTSAVVNKITSSSAHIPTGVNWTPNSSK